MNLEEFKTALAAKMTDGVEFVRMLLIAMPGKRGYMPAVVEQKNDDGTSRYVLDGVFDYAFGDHLRVAVKIPHRLPALATLLAHQVPGARWWAVREALRCDLSVPDGASWPELINAAGMTFEPIAHVFARPAASDPTRWAYTPSIEDGERDVQRLVTLPRLIRSIASMWHMTDHQIADADRYIRAELSSELDFEFGGAAIIDAYENGPDSCMSSSKGYWKRDQLGVNHVCEAYDAPGFGIARVRSSTGEISQRCLVWVNPNNPDDKRAVRVYGSGPLKRRLEKNGFTFANLDGARLKRIVAKRQEKVFTGSTTFVVPYLDAAQSANSGLVGVIDRGDSLEIVTGERLKTLQKLGEQYARVASSTSGLIDIVPINQDVLYWTCALSGERYDRTVYTPTPVIMPTSLDAPANVYEVPDTWLRGYYSSQARRVPIHPDVPTFVHVSGDVWVDTEVNRAYLGYIRLDSVLYPDRQDWKQSSDGLTEVDYLGRKIWVDTSDITAVIVKADDGSNVIRLVRSVADRVNYVRIRRTTTYPQINTLRARDVESVTVVSRGKSYESVPGVHDIAQTASGRWILNTDIRFVTAFDKTLAVGGDSFEGAMSDLGDWAARCADGVRSVIQPDSPFMRRACMSSATPVTDSVKRSVALSYAGALLRNLCTYTGQQLPDFPYNSARTAMYASSALDFVQLREHVVSTLGSSGSLALTFIDAAIAVLAEDHVDAAPVAPAAPAPVQAAPVAPEAPAPAAVAPGTEVEQSVFTLAA